MRAPAESGFAQRVERSAKRGLFRGAAPGRYRRLLSELGRNAGAWRATTSLTTRRVALRRFSRGRDPARQRVIGVFETQEEAIGMVGPERLWQTRQRLRPTPVMVTVVLERVEAFVEPGVRKRKFVRRRESVVDRYFQHAHAERAPVRAAPDVDRTRGVRGEPDFLRPGRHGEADTAVPHDWVDSKIVDHEVQIGKRIVSQRPAERSRACKQLRADDLDEPIATVERSAEVGVDARASGSAERSTIPLSAKKPRLPMSR